MSLELLNGLKGALRLFIVCCKGAQLYVRQCARSLVAHFIFKVVRGYLCSWTVPPPIKLCMAPWVEPYSNPVTVVHALLSLSKLAEPLPFHMVFT